MSVRTFGVSAVSAALAGGAAVAAAIIASGIAYADDGTDQINGWTVTPTDISDSGGTPATLSDPSDSLGLGTAPIVGGWDSFPATPLSSIGSDDQFITPVSTLGQPDFLLIDDDWMPGLELSSVQTGGAGDLSLTNAALALSHNGKEVVDLWQYGTPDHSLPLFNPDATSPIDIGGVELASPQDGALFNNLFDAVFLGDTADWSKAATLFDAWTGIDPSGVADAVDPAGVAVSAEAGAGSLPAANTFDGLLASAISNFTDADKLLNADPGVDATQPLSFNTDALQLLDQLQSAQDAISAHSGSLSSLVDQLFFVPLDQGWVDASDAMLHGAQELTATTASGLDIGLEVPSLQLIGDYLASVPIILAAGLF